MQAPLSEWLQSSKSRPCPVCGRTKDGDCKISADGALVNCRRGKTNKPPEWARGKSDHGPGADGQEWAYTGESSLEGWAVFTPHKSRTGAPPRGPKVVAIRPPAPAAAPAPDPATIELARLPKPHQQPPPHWANGKKLPYGSDGRQWVKVVVEADGKRHIPHHLDANGKAIGRAGPDPWPLWAESLALKHGPGKWIVEAEGEKCAGWFHAAAVVAVSQPGHAHSIDAIQARYARLVAAGVAGVVYLADHDKTGIEKARRCSFAAARARIGDQAAGLPFVSISAADVWPGLPEGGSIDDAPGTAAERVAAVEAHLRQPKPEPPPASTGPGDADKTPTLDDVEACLRQEINEGISDAGLATLITRLALDADIHASAIQQIANRLKAEHDRSIEVLAEAQAIAAEADRKDLGRVLTPDYLLPHAIANAIEVRTRYLPCEGPSAVLPFLTAIAGMAKLGTQVEASPTAGFTVPINMFSCLVGKSGAKKSPVHKLEVELPTKELEIELARANQRADIEWEEARRELKKRDPQPPKPRPIRLKVGGFTGEALDDQLQTQEASGLGLLIFRDELSGLFGSLNAYRGGRGADEQQLLELFDGGGMSSLRVIGGRHYSRSQVSIYGGTQPDILRQLVAGGDASGLWARFLFVPLPERAIPLPTTTSDAEMVEVEAAAKTLANACRKVYCLSPQTYRLSPAAAERFAQYELMKQFAVHKATVGAQSALHGKAGGKVLRVAGALHLLRIAAGEISEGDQIDTPTIDRATALVDHLDAWALSFHAEVAAGGIGQLMRTVHGTAEQTAAPIRYADVQQRLSKAQRKELDSAAVADAMRALADAGYGEVIPGKRGGLSYRAVRPLP
jgi:hypothetical protein